MRVPFIVYADFESFTPQLSTCHQPWQELQESSIRNTSRADLIPHKVFWQQTLFATTSYFFVKDINDDDVAQLFIDTLQKNIKEIYKKFKFPKSMITKMYDKLVYDNSTLSHNCNEKLGKDRVRNHCTCLVSLQVLSWSLQPKIQGFTVFPSCISQFVWLW